MKELHKISSGRRILVVLSLVIPAGVILYLVTGPPPAFVSGPESTDGDLQPILLDVPPGYGQQVRPVLERRCVVCHGCYDAPCQLKLSSVEGLQRGASKTLVYDPARITAAQPTRLFVDARNNEEWRSRGFHPVINEGSQSPESNLEDSVMYHLLRQKHRHPQPRAGRLPDSFTLGINREQTCPTQDTVGDYKREHPLWGMPYAMPNLSEDEYRTLVSWLAAGAPAPAPSGPSIAVLPQIGRWEDFLNQASGKSQLVSRYLYEHLFHAHIHFAGSPSREFYRLVRSTTPPGQTVDEIPTVRPYDDPGAAPFYYRLMKYQPGIVVKNHIVYEFSDERMRRYRELFLVPDYEVRDLPGYQPETASNPFRVFSDLPVKSRYQFLLDDARFFIEGFIKGPVCRGQVALNVIEDRFWVLFFDPDAAVFTNDAGFVGLMADELALPLADPGSHNLLGIWTDYWQHQRRYMATKQERFENIAAHDIDHALGYIWDGDGNNPNAALTVFRHFDSGSVAHGLVGDGPETAWVIDYPLFERIHYLLVAGFNVYGNLVHQLNTRIYMDFLRMEGEDHFLVFLPAERRKAIRDAWYAGLRAPVRKLFEAPQDWLQVKSVKGYLTDDPQQELYGYLRKRVAGVSRQANSANRCTAAGCPDKGGPAGDTRTDKMMQEIALKHGGSLHAFPDVAFVRVTGEQADEDIAYTLIRNKAYRNVTSFLADAHERDRSDTEKDTMTVVKWLEGSYPNFFFQVPRSELGDFVERCASIRNQADYEKFVNRYGVRRTNPGFWSMADWFQDEYARKHPVTSGLFDLNRYHNL